MPLVTVVFYSAYGHTYRMARAVVEGIQDVNGVEARLRQVPETLSPELLEELGIADAQDEFSDIPLCSLMDLEESEGLVFGTPTRFGNMCGQMRQFLDGTGGLWTRGSLVGKVGSVFASTATQHGGQETTIISFMLTLLHHGMLICGLPYTFQGQSRIDQMSGGSPYGATTIAGPEGERSPSENELQAARFQGARVAKTVRKLHS